MDDKEVKGSPFAPALERNNSYQDRRKEDFKGLQIELANSPDIKPRVNQQVYLVKKQVSLDMEIQDQPDFSKEAIPQPQKR